MASPMAGYDYRLSTLTEKQFLVNNSQFSIDDYGGDPTGATSSNDALTKIGLAMGGGRYRIIDLGPGTYYFADFDASAFSSVLFRGIPGRTKITGGTALVPSHTTPATTSLCSRRALKFTTASNLFFQDIIFDGQQPLGPSWYQASYVDQQAIIEFRSCTRIFMLRCDFTNFTPAFPANGSGGLQNADLIEDYNHGPIFLRDCITFMREDTRLLAPCFGEGLIAMNQVGAVDIRPYSNAGYDTDATYGTSTPIHYMGPNTARIEIIDPYLYHSNGSAMQLSGAGPFEIVRPEIDACGGINASLGNVGYFGDYDVTGLGVYGRGGHIKNLIDNPHSTIPAVYIGSRTDGGFQYEAVHIEDVTFDRCYDFADIRGCKDVKLRGLSGRRCLLSGASGGTGLFVGACSGVDVMNNTIDGTVDVGGAGATTRLKYAVAVQDSDDVQIVENRCIDPSAQSVRATVTDSWDLPFTGGGTALRDQLFQLLWGITPGPITVTGATSGATATFVGRVLTGGAWVGNTAAGTIRIVSKVGVFVLGENLNIGANLAAAVAGGDATLISAMNRISIHDNNSRTITTTTQPYFIQPVNLNAMVGQYSRCNNMHNGVYIDPLETGTAAIGDADYTIPTAGPYVATYTANQTANRKLTIPATPAYVGQKVIINRYAAGNFTLTVQTSTPTTILVIPANVTGRFVFQYLAGWRCIEQSVTPIAGMLAASAVALNTGAGAGAGTITNAPAAGNPTKWIPISDNGTIRYIPAW